MADNDVRVTLRIPKELDEKLGHYASLNGISKNKAIVEAMDLYLKVRYGLYDFNEPALQRLDQLVDAMGGMNARLDRQHDVMHQMTDLIIRYSSGENYYND